MSNRNKFNPKRYLREPLIDKAKRGELAKKVNYTGSPYHKQNPGDFGLTPPAAPRADKTLCDGVEIFEKNLAQDLLEAGVSRGLVSKQERKGFPQNIWSVTDSGVPLEAQLENTVQGTYHGYPLIPRDPLYQQVLEWWEQS